MAIFLSPVHDLAGSIFDAIVFGIHFMLAQVFYLDRSESSQTSMEGNFRKPYTFYLQAFDELAAEVQTGSGSRYSTFMFRIYRLVTLFIFLIGFSFNVFGKRGFAQL